MADERAAARTPDPRAPLGRREKPDKGPGWRVDPSPDGRGAKPEKPPMIPFSFRRFLAILAILLVANYVFVAIFAPEEKRERVPYTPTFIEQVQKRNVKEISSKGETVQGEFRKEIKKGDPKGFETEVPTFADQDQLSQLLQANDVTVNARPPQDRNLVETLLFSFGPVLLLVGLFVFLARRASKQAGGGMLGQFGKSKARRSEIAEQRITFNDVAGIDEAKQELTEIVSFLADPDRFRRLGARMPRGVLLSGLPGTGKTLLAKAVAGEAGVPFFSISASEFIEAIVGVGASRVRDLFQQAKDAAPAIIFIDELDAIGRARGGGAFSSGGTDEREQTLNQILTEMDGFDTNVGVIVVAATNRPEILDPALLRPGRFDRRVAVQPPDLIGRRRILDVHTRSVPLADDVDLDMLAATTPGMVGADLANVVNEAALVAATRDHEQVEPRDFTDAIEKIILGAERKVVQSPEDRRRIAYHEGGHAIVGMLTPGADPVRKVSIIPRGQALGVTLSAPEADRFNYDEQYLVGKIKVALGGRVAEEMEFGDVTTGAESDIQQVTQLARGMVARWGMSEEIGFLAVQGSESQGMLLPGVDNASEATQELVEREMRRIVDEAQDDVRELLDRERSKLEALAETLLREETLDEAAAYKAAGIERTPAPV